MLVILRMNRKFMEFMRTNDAELAKSLADQHFGCTVVEEAATEKEVTGEEGVAEI